MGYTHYCYQKPQLDKDNWQAFISDVRKILANPDVPLAYEYNQTHKPPQIDDDVVRFNGHGADGHETFMLTREAEVQDYLGRGEDMAFSFCKTARKPYDKYVTACLILAKIYFGADVRISSDGDIGNWDEGKEIVERLFGKSITITETDLSFQVEVAEDVEA